MWGCCYLGYDIFVLLDLRVGWLVERKKRRRKGGIYEKGSKKGISLKSFIVLCGTTTRRA